MTDKLPGIEEANADIYKAAHDVSCLRAAWDALERLVNTSDIENKADYRRVMDKLSNDIAHGNRLINDIKKLIESGKIK